jgi:hypothetical protein
VPAGLDGELAVGALDAAAGQLDVLGAQGPLDIGHGEPARGQAGRIEPQPHGEFFGSPPIITWLTPGTVCRRSFTCNSAMRVNSAVVKRSL